MVYVYVRHTDGCLSVTVTPETPFDVKELAEHPWVPGAALLGAKNRMDHVCVPGCH